MTGQVNASANDGPILRLVPAAEVRARIGGALHDAAGDATLGEVTLRPHQRLAVTRVRRAIEELGGALLADEPGLGKSYVALAVARQIGDALLVCPASLRTTWIAAMRAADVRLRAVSQETLSRGALVAPARLIVVDEAHHFRNSATRRYRALATLAADALVLLLTATPVHNSERDLDALLALFRGRAPAPDDALLARCVVRRTHAGTATATLPAVQPTKPFDVDDDAGIVERIAALPPPLSIGDGADAAALVQMTLLRQWASSATALRGGIARHLARTDALVAILESGRLPTRRELASWTIGDDAMQLAFPELMASREVAPARFIEAARRHRTAIAGLRDVVRDTTIDERRAELLREILGLHGEGRVLCFAQYEETVRMYWRALRHLPGVCALSSRGATIAGGTLSRREALARFAPLAHGGPRPGRVDEVRVLLATDMLSEGVNLQDASVVVHLDVPWTPARMEQRVGRVARLGSAHERVSVYAIRAPNAAARMLAIERRLLAKSSAASRAHRSPDAAERVAGYLAEWCGEQCPHECPGVVSVAAVRAPASGWLAMVGRGSTARLVASAATDRGTSPLLLADACRLASGPDAVCLGAQTRHAIGELEAWLAAERASTAAGLHDAPTVTRRASLRQVAGAGTVSRARRGLLADLAGSAWRAASSPMSLGREERLRAIGVGAGLDRDWLQAVAKINAGKELSAPGGGHTEAGDELLALILFVP